MTGRGLPKANENLGELEGYHSPQVAVTVRLNTNESPYPPPPAYVDALAAIGRREEGREIFEHLLSCRNHLGLLSEDIDPDTGELWGNFPQTYSMVGIINGATRLSRRWETVL